MALSIEEDSVLVSMLPYGPWSRLSGWMGMEESRLVLGLGGLLTA